MVETVLELDTVWSKVLQIWNSGPLLCLFHFDLFDTHGDRSDHGSGHLVVHCPVIIEATNVATFLVDVALVAGWTPAKVLSRRRRQMHRTATLEPVA